MRHRRRVKHFSRDKNARKALLRGLVVSLVQNGRISTTVEKAKEVKRHVEKVITLGKKGDLAAFRLILSRYPNKDFATSVVKDVSPRFKSRNGGYTRIIKIGRRPGDTAEMAFLEFVDYDFADKAAKEMGKSAEPKASAKTSRTKKTGAKKTVASAAKKPAKKSSKEVSKST